MALVSDRGRAGSGAQSGAPARRASAKGGQWGEVCALLATLGYLGAMWMWQLPYRWMPPSLLYLPVATLLVWRMVRHHRINGIHASEGMRFRFPAALWCLLWLGLVVMTVLSWLGILVKQ